MNETRRAFETSSVRIVIPLLNPEVIDDDTDRWITRIGQSLANLFGDAVAAVGEVNWTDEDGDHSSPAAMIASPVIGELTELDRARVFGLGLLVWLKLHRRGTAVVFDDGIFVW